MKPSEVTELGFYWCLEDGEWAIVQAVTTYDGGRMFMMHNYELEVFPEQIEGELYGPLVPPVLT